MLKVAADIVSDQHAAGGIEQMDAAAIGSGIGRAQVAEQPVTANVGGAGKAINEDA